MHKRINLIVAECNAEGTRTFGRVHEQSFKEGPEYSNLVQASIEAQKHVGSGKAIIIRPNYNEYAEDGKVFYREWRSFNGNPFQEVRFESGLSSDLRKTFKETIEKLELSCFSVGELNEIEVSDWIDEQRKKFDLPTSN